MRSMEREMCCECVCLYTFAMESAQFRVSALADIATPHVQYVERHVLCLYTFAMESAQFRVSTLADTGRHMCSM